MRSTVIAVLILVASPAATFAASPNCNVPGIRTLPDQTVDGYMTMRTGKRCSVSMLTSSGPTESTQIVSRPSNGAVTTDRNRITYTPKAGFVGADTFTYARKGLTNRGVPATRTVKMNVTVSP